LGGAALTQQRQGARILMMKVIILFANPWRGNADDGGQKPGKK